MLSALPATATTSGVRVSWRPRRTPVVASMTSSGVVPRKAIRRYVVAGSVTAWSAPNSVDQRAGGRDAGDGDQHPDEDGQPDPVDALGQGRAPVAGAEQPGHARRGAVGEEDAQADHRLEHDGGDAEARERGGAEVPDDGGVGEQEERLRDQGQERGQGEPPDLAVERVGHLGSVRAWLRA